MQARTGSGTSTKYCNNGKWAPVVPGNWYTASVFSTNTSIKEKPQPAPANSCPTSLLHPFASVFLLTHLGFYAFLGWFNPLLSRYQIFGEKFHLGMVSLPIGSMCHGQRQSYAKVPKESSSHQDNVSQGPNRGMEQNRLEAIGTKFGNNNFGQTENGQDDHPSSTVILGLWKV
ncbi:hypothetical protein DSO57_1014572 [Entomophthora muscae]|uniref:Uncharacterized protein n=1 Tax=Entomophthora muscae TaxID=34485 RepID=A0ACC2SUL1_9FUNG|nr:hypothetical protein DSO57_1014572 [Entomophthora muscae]